jgi:hypothetical protein
MCAQNSIKDQAKRLAKANRESEPTISDVYWFPDDHEVRLVEVDTAVPRSPDGKVHPFRFRPSPGNDLPAPSDVAIISPEEVKKADLPEGWGTWDNGEKLEEE